MSFTAEGLEIVMEKGTHVITWQLWFVICILAMLLFLAFKTFRIWKGPN
jgi:hypothetical protein